MKRFRIVSAVALGTLLALPLLAQETNEQSRKETKAVLKQQEQADKSQAKADKAEKKAAGSHKVKKAARKQDKADAVAAQTPQ